MTLTTLTVDGQAITLRQAALSDLGAIVALLADDEVRAADASTTDADREGYERSFRAIDADPAHLLVVATSATDSVVATMQLTFLPGLSRGGATRLQIEAVRVHSGVRGLGLGGAMIDWAIGEGRRRGASLVQLTSDNSRADAHRFYERLGFTRSHAGFKLSI